MIIVAADAIKTGFRVRRVPFVSAARTTLVPLWIILPLPRVLWPVFKARLLIDLACRFAILFESLACSCGMFKGNCG
jgi:hypothetical protein